MGIRERIRLKSGRVVSVRAHIAEMLVETGEAEYVDLEYTTVSPPENEMRPKGRGRVRS